MRLRFTLLVCLLCSALLALPSAQSGVRYIYDETGRLVGVIDLAGDAAAYHYDAVGNLLSITRSTSTQLTHFTLGYQIDLPKWPGPTSWNIKN